MIVYIDLVIMLNFLVDALLILAVSRYCGTPVVPWRAIAGGMVGGLYGGACMIPGFTFLGGALWRVIALVAIGCIAFGCKRTAVSKTLIFAVFNMTLGGMVVLLNAGNILAVILCAGAVAGMSVFVSKRNTGRKVASVELRKGDRYRKLFALRDTGNTLCDPLTGMQVLVAGANIAREMLGLDTQQLGRPDETITQLNIRGSRLVPYRTIENGAGMLLAVPMDSVLIDGVAANTLVAFSPVDIGKGEDYEALTGGNL